ncbi:hypothetical protein E2C01_046165 [Portunus trituberculatus]|uniref:Uncharacterized protein n=1 Tax=Portunus trituberculatus TaxID=210409 RepID=A0A5B7FXQ4_PORTR|nr:hypothetical protein [Portunus trituberculatus]
MGSGGDGGGGGNDGGVAQLPSAIPVIRFDAFPHCQLLIATLIGLPPDADLPSPSRLRPNTR